jgi:hypothetical protein
VLFVQKQPMAFVRELFVAKSIVWFFLKVVDFMLAISNGTQSSIKCSITNNQARGSCFQEKEKEDGKDEPCFWSFTLECARLWKEAFFKCFQIRCSS